MVRAKLSRKTYCEFRQGIDLNQADPPSMEDHCTHPIVLSDLEAIVGTDLPWERFRGKKILVTGAGGLVGSFIVWSLLALNRRFEYSINVIASGRNKSALQMKLGQHPDLSITELSLPSTIPPDLDADFIIHLASPSRTSIHRENPLRTIGPNVFGTQALLEMAKRSTAEGFLFVSSGAVYGQPNLPDGQRVREDVAASYNHLNPAMSYAEGKRMGEFLCCSWSEQHGLPTTIARLGHTYGPGLEETDERVFADFVFRILHNQPLVIKSAGTAVRPFCYISDAVIGLFTILLRGDIGQAYNLVNPYNEYSMLELAFILHDTFPERNVRVEVLGQESHSFQNSILLSTDKLEALGWQPKVSVREGFRRTIASFNTA